MSLIAERVRRRLVRSRAPTGLISLDYLNPWASPDVRLHRHLLSTADPRIPRLVYWPLQAASYVRFLRHAPPSRSVDVDAQSESATRAQLRCRHTISPATAHKFGLDHHPDRWPRYIYDREAGAFHAMRNRILGVGSPGELQRQVQEIQDKARTAATLDRLGIATPRTFRRTEAGDPVALGPLVRDLGPVFCKPRSGSRGENAFIVRFIDGEARMQRYHSSSHEVDGADYARSQFAARPYLIQQHLRSHQDLIPPFEATGWDVATVRLITHSPQVAGPRVYSAIVEIPRPHSDSDSQPFTYFLSVLDPADGTVLRSVDTSETSGFPAPGSTIPHWTTLLSNGLSAHEKYASVYSIAWDFAITPEGPLLLEGNASWGVETPQMAHGPILLRPPVSDH